METVDEAASLDLILAKIVTAIAKFYKKKPTSFFKSECHDNDTTCEKEENLSASRNVTFGSNADVVDGIREASTLDLNPNLLETGDNGSKMGESLEEHEDLMNKAIMMNKSALGDFHGHCPDILSHFELSDFLGDDVRDEEREEEEKLIV